MSPPRRSHCARSRRESRHDARSPVEPTLSRQIVPRVRSDRPSIDSSSALITAGLNRVTFGRRSGAHGRLRRGRSGAKRFGSNMANGIVVDLTAPTRACDLRGRRHRGPHTILSYRHAWSTWDSAMRHGAAVGALWRECRLPFTDIPYAWSISSGTRSRFGPAVANGPHGDACGLLSGSVLGAGCTATR